jgi:HK97 gp10 family phage protein
MQMNLDIKGAAELAAMLQQLGPRVTRLEVVNALREGARIIRDEAKRRAPVGPEQFTRFRDYDEVTGGRRNVSGQLRSAIKVKTDAYKGGTKRRVVVVVSQKSAGINPHWVEFGTTSQRVAKRGGLMTFVIDGRLIRKKVVAGVRARPFMRPAADAKFAEAVRAIGERLGAGIEKQAQALGKRL